MNELNSHQIKKIAAALLHEDLINTATAHQTGSVFIVAHSGDACIFRPEKNWRETGLVIELISRLQDLIIIDTAGHDRAYICDGKDIELDDGKDVIDCGNLDVTTINIQMAYCLFLLKLIDAGMVGDLPELN